MQVSFQYSVWFKIHIRRDGEWYAFKCNIPSVYARDKNCISCIIWSKIWSNNECDQTFYISTSIYHKTYVCCRMFIMRSQCFQPISKLFFNSLRNSGGQHNISAMKIFENIMKERIKYTKTSANSSQTTLAKKKHNNNIFLREIFIVLTLFSSDNNVTTTFVLLTLLTICFFYWTNASFSLKLHNQVMLLFHCVKSNNWYSSSLKILHSMSFRAVQICYFFRAHLCSPP